MCSEYFNIYRLSETSVIDNQIWNAMWKMIQQI